MKPYPLPEEPTAMLARELPPSYQAAPGLAFGNRMAMSELIKQGLSFRFFDALAKLLPFNENDWAKLLDVSTKTLQRYRQQSKVFGPLHSEKLIQMAEITTIGLDVFGAQDSWEQWISTPCYALGNAKPKDLIQTSYGQELILRELQHINHGIFA